MNDLEAAMYVLDPETNQTLARLHHKPDLVRYVLPLLGPGTRGALYAFKALRRLAGESPLGPEFENYGLTEFGEQLLAACAAKYPNAQLVLDEDALERFRQVLEDRGLAEGR